MPFVIGIYGIFAFIFWIVPSIIVRVKKKKGEDWSGAFGIANLILIRYFIPCILGLALLFPFLSSKSERSKDFPGKSHRMEQTTFVVEPSSSNKEDFKIFAEYKKKAEQGDAEAQFQLAKIYDDGNGVKQDKKEACLWYRMAADQGYAKAQYNLGWMYGHGCGVSLSKKEAAKWFKVAAEQGHVSAQYNLAIMHEQGDGVEKDKLKSVEYYILAAKNGNTNAQFTLGAILDPLNDDWPETPLNREESRKWLRLAAEQGHVMAQYLMGSIYEEGIGVPYNREEAIKWYKLAAAQGHEKSKKLLKQYGSGF